VFVEHAVAEGVPQGVVDLLESVEVDEDDGQPGIAPTGIGQRLFAEMAPKWLRIGGYWYPRGGMPIDVFYQTGPAPAGVWIPDQGVPPYRGRG
jgi:hypothetical protein